MGRALQGPGLGELPVWRGTETGCGLLGQSTEGRGPDGCTRIDRRSQAGPEIEQTRKQKDGRLPSTHSVNSVNSPSLENGPIKWGFSFFFLPMRKLDLKGREDLATATQLVDGRAWMRHLMDPRLTGTPAAQSSSGHVQRSRGTGLEAPDCWVGGWWVGGGAGLSTPASSESATRGSEPTPEALDYADLDSPKKRWAGEFT